MAFLCGCEPRSGVICNAHCQIQGCERRDGGRHTAECVRGERIEPTGRTWFAGEERYLNIDKEL
jgi:hypothetical protein